mmetsp:Transcript_41754/g.119427  ORF Transcript_41754/g.119427 Transcript_41754/m.119427 type:complete len:164 (+) Transcript_41754:78-569(+)
MARARTSLLSVVFALAALAALLNTPTFVGTPALRGEGRPARIALQAASADTMSKVAGIIAEQLGVDKAKVIREATLSELGADSLDIVESIMALEEGFDVELPDEETTAMKNVGDVMEWNAANPDKAVLKDEYIIAVNGRRGNAQQLTEVFKNDDKLEITVQRR